MTAALNTRRKKVMVKVLKVLQNLVMCDINKGDGAGGLIGQVRHQFTPQSGENTIGEEATVNL
jgi:hypothetical protein